eukprot:2078604-Prymnesium_polylepis.1
MPQIVGGMQTDITVKPDDGCYIYGAFLEGARWDVAEHCLAESRPKELFVDFPAIHLNPKVGRQTPKEGVYSCPMYKTTVRAGLLSTTGHSTNFVLMVEVPSKEACSGNFHKYIETYSAHWILRAVALFTTLSARRIRGAAAGGVGVVVRGARGPRREIASHRARALLGARGRPAGRGLFLFWLLSGEGRLGLRERTDAHTSMRGGADSGGISTGSVDGIVLRDVCA